MTASPDYAPMTLRRVGLLQDRVDMVYYSLYITTLVTFFALMIALYSVRKDIINKIEGMKI